MDNMELKIIETTINCIEQFGLDKITIRLIAKEAGVNSAAISYYFRSKDNLVDIAMNMTLENAFRWEDFAYTFDMPPKEQLKEILNFLSEGALKHPNITKAHLIDPFLKNDYSGNFVKKINEFAENLFAHALSKGLSCEENAFRQVIHQGLVTGLLQFGFSPRLLNPFLQKDLTEKTAREEYISDLVDKLFESR